MYLTLSIHGIHNMRSVFVLELHEIFIERLYRTYKPTSAESHQHPSRDAMIATEQQSLESLAVMLMILVFKELPLRLHVMVLAFISLKETTYPSRKLSW